MSIIYIHLAQIIVVQSEINFVTIKKKSTISEKSIKKKNHLYSGCKEGFYTVGPFCMKCPYPLFGLECQDICECDNETCSHVNGCIGTTSDSGKITLILYNK